MATSTLGASPRPPSHLVDTSSLSVSPSSAYTLSLPPTYRRSSYPLSPQPLFNAHSFIPPGIALEPRGCSDDDDFLRATGRDPREALAPSYPALCVRGFDAPLQRLPATPPTATGSNDDDDEEESSSPSPRSSRKSSQSSLESYSSGAATPLSSLASSLHNYDAVCAQTAASSASTSPAAKSLGSASASGSLLSSFDWGRPSSAPSLPPPPPRSLSAPGGLGKSKREAVKGWEDPALAAARRALWEDPSDVVAPEEPSRTPVVEEVPEVEEEDDESGDDGDEEDEREEWVLPPARPSGRSLTTPLYSCFRNSSSSRSASSSFCDGSSMSSSSLSESGADSSSLSSATSDASTDSSSTPTSASGCQSVSFSVEPPETCPTYSATAYVRRGDAPVEKLSIRDWMELQGVREAVGVWSGKIQNWEEFQSALQAEAATPTRCVSVGRNCEISTGASEVGERRGKTPFSLAGVVGVRTVARSTPSSPTSPLLSSSP